MADSLREYRPKRDFKKTAEPSGDRAAARPAASATSSRGTPRPGSISISAWSSTACCCPGRCRTARASNPNDKRLAVRTEDHPLDYGDFEGTIPKGEYGGGTVMLWDEGTWEPVGDPEEGLAKGDLKFILHGERLKGKWVLVRMRRSPASARSTRTGC